MAEKTRKYYTCDRCRVEMDQPVRGNERGPIAYTLTLSEDVGVAGGAVANWQHLCGRCNGYVGSLRRKISEDIKALRAETEGE